MSLVMPNLAAFLAYISLTAFTPGPNNFMALNNAGHYGFRRSIRFCFGVFLGFLVVMSACAGLSGLLYAAIPEIEPWLRRAGAAYLLLLAWLVWREPAPGANGPNASVNSLWTGLIMQLVNVKVIIYGLTALSVFVLPHYRSALSVGLFVLILSLMGFLGTMTWAGFGSLLQNLFRSHHRAVKLVLALALVLCAVSTVME